MLTKVEPMEIMTLTKCRQRYADKWFSYVFVEKEEDLLYATSFGNFKVIVLYTADSCDELMVVSREEKNATGFYSGGTDCGVNVNPEPWISIGGLEIERLQNKD